MGGARRSPHSRDPSGAVARWSSRPIRPEVWRVADTVCRRRFLRSDALRLGLRYVALPGLRASGDGSCPQGPRFPGPPCLHNPSLGAPRWPGALAAGGLLSLGGGFEVRRPLPSAVNLRWLWRRAWVERGLPRAYVRASPSPIGASRSCASAPRSTLSRHTVRRTTGAPHAGGGGSHWSA